MSNRNPIISVHLPKSGGSSIRADLEQQFGARALFDYGRGPLGPRAHEIEHGLNPEIDLVHGHFRPARYDAVQNAFRFTFLRQPVDLLLSLYFFWRDMAPRNRPLHDRFLAERPSIEVFAEWPLIRTFTSNTFFGDYDMSKFDFVGFHETRNQDMDQLNILADLKLDASRHDNATTGGSAERQAILEDAAKMALLRDLLIDDVRFYDKMREARS